MTKFEKVFQILEKTGTNWTAKKINLIADTEERIKTDSYGIFRSDNNGWLGTVKERYTPTQNAFLVETLVDATSSLDLELTNGGILKNGSKVFYQMALPNEYIGKSVIKRNITAINSHDGSTAVAFGSTNTVVVCQNTFFRAYREMEKIKHTVSSTNRITEMANNLKMTIDLDLLMMDNFKRMADIEMKDEHIENLIKKLFNKDLNKDMSQISTRAKNQIQTFADNLTTEINLEGKTLWGLFNAVTRYTNHEAAPKDEQKKLDYLMNGSGLMLSNMAYDQLINEINKNVAEYHFIEK